LLIVFGGLAAMAKYDQNPGTVGNTPHEWPVTAAQVALDPSRPTLVMFAHPKCPCTRASLAELNRLLARCEGQVAVHLFFFAPEEAPADWKHTGLWDSAESIPGVVVEQDPGGALAKRFGAETSGFVALYDPHGRLLFKGGITAGRGHEGDNEGESTIAALLTANTAPVRPETRVFGCPIQNPELSLQANVTATTTCTRP
jgi:hypothetical protein